MGGESTQDITQAVSCSACGPGCKTCHGVHTFDLTAAIREATPIVTAVEGAADAEDIPSVKATPGTETRALALTCPCTGKEIIVDVPVELFENQHLLGGTP